ncbi:MAG: hypothetical protein AB7F43_10905 [Bacteriovoracia bacterium]
MFRNLCCILLIIFSSISVFATDDVGGKLASISNVDLNELSKLPPQKQLEYVDKKIEAIKVIKSEVVKAEKISIGDTIRYKMSTNMYQWAGQFSSAMFGVVAAYNMIGGTIALTEIRCPMCLLKLLPAAGIVVGTSLASYLSYRFSKPKEKTTDDTSKDNKEEDLEEDSLENTVSEEQHASLIQALDSSLTTLQDLRTTIEKKMESSNIGT